MNTWSLYGLFTVAVALTLCLFYVVYSETHHIEITQSAHLAALLEADKKPLPILERTQETDCNINGPLPDRECTPGAIFESATLSEICVSGYSKTVRKVSASLKKKVFTEYGLNSKQPYGSYEVDHLIPLAIGGSNDIANLFPEAATPYPGFKEKDVVENYLHEKVCNREISLGVAQSLVAHDWLSIYNSLDEKLIQDFKNRFPNWAD